ncbi:MAG: ABC transporter permease subunit [Bacillus sp. (in: Bacteria)]|nr:ABC transporter permease subunit [Bacillus sp. (in: firmicutes)]MCM1428130.1 ABC transporter permease subunit [Eubacterium sp.]
MKIWKLEVKKILKTRRTWVLIAAALSLSVMMAYLPVTYKYADSYSETGERVELQGTAAIAYLKEARADFTGVVTPQKVRMAVEEYQACLREYGVTESYDLPDGVYSQRLLPFAHLIRGVREAFANRENGTAPSVMEIEPERVDNYYEACEERLESLTRIEHKDNPDIGGMEMKMYQDVEKPYLYYSGYTGDAMEYVGFLGFLLLLICVIITAPAFSSDYQTGADDILRCTKYGRVRLGIAKAASTAGITTVLFIVCMAVHIVISNSFFGWESLKTSIQMIFSITNLVDWNLWDMQLAVAFAALAALAATISVTLFISAKCRNVVTALVISFIVCLAPVFLSFISADSSIALWLHCLLPSNGACPPDSFLYQAVDYEFIKAGGLILWTPYAMVIFAVIEAVLFAVLAVRSYMTYRMKN